MNGSNIEETKISAGIVEFEKFKALAAEAIERCKKAEDEASYHKGQNDMLLAQRQELDARHRSDLGRIAELEGFIANILEQYRSAEEKLRLGHFRRPNSVKSVPAPDLESAMGSAIEDELRKLRPLVDQKA